MTHHANDQSLLSAQSGTRKKIDTCPGAFGFLLGPPLGREDLRDLRTEPRGANVRFCQIRRVVDSIYPIGHVEIGHSSEISVISGHNDCAVSHGDTRNQEVCPSDFPQSGDSSQTIELGCCCGIKRKDSQLREKAFRSEQPILSPQKISSIGSFQQILMATSKQLDLGNDGCYDEWVSNMAQPLSNFRMTRVVPGQRISIEDMHSVFARFDFESPPSFIDLREELFNRLIAC